MLERKHLDSKSGRQFLAAMRSYQRQNSEPRQNDPQQRQAMLIALALLLCALGLLLYHDRDFWFPDTQMAEDSPEHVLRPSLTVTQAPVGPPAASKPAVRKKPHTKSQVLAAVQPIPVGPVSVDPSTPPITATATRTILPPLEVEVVAGNVHRTMHSAPNTVHVDLQPDSSEQSTDEPTAAPSIADNTPDTAAAITSNASERVEMSADTTDVVAQPVKPGYPTLARQMKVQGSVILQALIGRDGLIQDLRVLSGPPILAAAAQQAVRQWHFKPHFLGSDTVETQARITVNFTISTN